MHKLFTKRAVFISLFILVVFMFSVLPLMSKMIADIVGDIPSPDTSLIYSGDELYDMAENYGTLGRRVYVIQRVSFDVVWPLVYGMFIFTTIGCTFKNSKFYKYLIVLPFLAVGFDYLENIGSTLTFLVFPTRNEVLLSITPMFTFIKWIFVSLGFTLSLVLLIRILLKRSD